VITPIEALRLIADEGCESSAERIRDEHSGLPPCFKPGSGHLLYATYGADRACPSCTARLALIAAGEPADRLSLMADVGPRLPDQPYLSRCIERGARWDPAGGWTAWTAQHPDAAVAATVRES
jgi:hypothetical protein